MSGSRLGLPALMSCNQAGAVSHEHTLYLQQYEMAAAFFQVMRGLFRIVMLLKYRNNSPLKICAFVVMATSEFPFFFLFLKAVSGNKARLFANG